MGRNYLLKFCFLIVIIQLTGCSCGDSKNGTKMDDKNKELKSFPVKWENNPEKINISDTNKRNRSISGSIETRIIRKKNSWDDDLKVSKDE
jgi:hypothetical protein